MSRAWYNENDAYAAAWLRNLVAAGHLPPGDVDDRSILDVRAADLVGYSQCHFFAGIGGWPHALRLAGWPDDHPVWCSDGKTRRTQPFLQFVDDGLPGGLAGLPAEAGFPLTQAFAGRAGALRGIGNAIVPQVAAAFIAAWLEARP